MARGLTELGYEVRLLGKTNRSTARFVFFGLASVARERPDHIISTHVNFGPAAQLAKRFFGTPFTLIAHGIDVHQGLPERTLAAMRDADRIISVSEWTRMRVLDLGGFSPANVTVLPNTIDEERFTVGEKSAKLRQQYGLAPDEKVVLTVARLDPRERYKGYDRIIEALPAIQKACGPVRFLIVGAGGDKPRVAALARDAGVESLVSFAGFVPADSLVDHYRLADVFAMPSTGEGFGIVFLEAMGCGTPVIAGNRDGSVDALDNGRLGMLVEPMSIDAIANGIVALLRKEGPAWWFDRQALHDAASKKFGHSAFISSLREALPFEQ